MQIGTDKTVVRQRNDEDVKLMEQVQSITSLEKSKEQENVRLGAFLLLLRKLF